MDKGTRKPAKIYIRFLAFFGVHKRHPKTSGKTTAVNGFVRKKKIGFYPGQSYLGIFYEGRRVLIRSSQSLPGRQTVGYHLLELTAISGEFPVNQLTRLPGGDFYKANVVKVLKQKHLLRTCYRDGLRGYRLTIRAKELLTADQPDRFLPCLTGATETNHIRSEPFRRMRLHRISETLITMQNAGVAVYRDEKPDIFSPVWKEGVRLFIEYPAFYHSREVKELGTVFVKIKGARSVGVLLTQSNVFVVYNLGDTLMKWQYRAEMRTKTLMQTVLCRERLPDQYKPEDVRGLLLGDSMKLANDILSSEGGKQYFLLDGSYEHFYYLTNDHRGEKILRLLCNAEMSEKLDAILLADLEDRDERLPLENDAVDSGGNPVLLSYVCDLPRIKRFDTALQLQNRTGTVICYDFQADTLCRSCGERVQFQTIDFEKWERRFFP